MSPAKSDADRAVALLRAGWQRFCARLEQAGEQAFLPGLPSAPRDRMAGLRQVARNIALALQFEVENADPLHPVLAHYFDPVRKQGGDNPDALYLGAPVNGSARYRISGVIGSAAYLAVTAVGRGDTPFGGRAVATLAGDAIRRDADGRFVLEIGPRESHPAGTRPAGANWIETTPDTCRLTIRQFFADWENEVPMRAFIECLDAPGPRPVPTPEELVAGLDKAAAWLDGAVRYWAEMLARWKAQPQRFLAYAELEHGAVDATPGGAPVICWWALRDDEALVVRVVPRGDARYWSAELGNGWWESMDYRDRLASTNGHYARLEEDGELIAVVAHRDPGVPNWLDASGHGEGYLTFRWIGTASLPRPVAEKVAFSALPQHLAGKRRITPEGRRAQMLARRRGLQIRGFL